MRKPFTRRGDVVRVELSAEERQMLSTLPELIAASGDAGGRLDYRAHGDDEEAEERYREVVGTSLEEARDRDRIRFTSGVSHDEVGLDDAEAWMRVIGEARIVLAVGLGIEEDGWEVDADSAQDPEMALLGYLGYLQDELVGALTDA